MRPERGFFTESETKKILSGFGVMTLPFREAASPEEAAACAEEIGFPVVMKISSAEALHKTDIGGVILNIVSRDQAAEAAARILSLCAGARVLVEKQAGEGVADLILGFKRDPVFGPVLMAGFGGIHAEILADTSLHVGHVDIQEAREMLLSLKARRVLEGARGRPAADIEAAAEALIALSNLAFARPDILELDINPLRVFEKGALALDAAAVISRDAPLAVSPRASDVADIRERMEMLFRPRGVAVVGASSTSEKAGNVIIKNLKTFGYKGRIYPVNPSGATIEGLPSCKSVAECPPPLDLAVLAIPYHQVESVMKDVARIGTRHAIVASGGFSDAGAEGRAREADLLDFCRAHGIHLMGPNSIGTIDAKFGFCTSIGKLPPMPPSGVSIFGQTGTFSTGFSLEEISCRARGFSKVACIGNKSDVDESDFLEYYAADPDTRCIGIYIEGVKDGPRFSCAARNAAAAKPVVILKSGRTEVGAKAAASHTGSMAGADAVYDAVFRQTGMQRVNDFAEFFEVLRAFDMCALPRGNRIGVVSITGVGCVLAADACGRYDMALAPIAESTLAKLKALTPAWATISNPADIWSTIEQLGPAEAFGKMSDAMISDKNVDVLLVIHVLLEEGSFDAGAVFAEVKAAHPDKPILACTLGGRKDLLESFRGGLEQIGIPVFNGPAAAVRAASFLHRRKLIAEKSLPARIARGEHK